MTEPAEKSHPLFDRVKATVSAHVLIVERPPSRRPEGEGARILLVRLAYKDHRWSKWSFPGGYVDQGETLEQALKREVVEEIGLQLFTCERVEAVPMLQSECPNIGFIYLCEEWTGEPAIKSREILETAWVDELSFRRMDQEGQLAYPQMRHQTGSLGWRDESSRC
ncbi:MAG: NUDIX hydrolase [Magnetococcales bacterium]|nr:NUDIX hydrolase [Magnetococcales bacterium]